MESYQHSPPAAVGPGISKIMQEMERQRKREVEGEEMKRRTRILYVILGVALLFLYLAFAKKHFFQRIQKEAGRQPQNELEASQLRM